jgi:hypothetical protein
MRCINNTFSLNKGPVLNCWTTALECDDKERFSLFILLLLQWTDIILRLIDVSRVTYVPFEM